MIFDQVIGNGSNMPQVAKNERSPGCTSLIPSRHSSDMNFHPALRFD